MQQEPNWQRLSALNDGDLQMSLLNWIDELMDGHYGEEEDTILGGLRPPLNVMFLLNWLDFELTQGSFLAYFLNSHGRHARLAAQALKTIGAAKTASVLERAVGVFEANSAAWNARNEEMDQLEEFAVVRPYVGLPGADELSDLTEKYWDAQRSDRYTDLLNDYFRRSVVERAGGN
ncbi:MAG TPA: DUF4375 domain-containing protein [Candidatus Dormibacteraeota bacterium]